MDKELGLITLTKIVKDNIKHQDYERVTKLADTYYKMISGDGICDLLHQITKRETKEEFEMRKAITNSVIPPTLASTKLPFQKAVRTKALSRKIDWENGGNENLKAELDKIIGKYWGDASLEKFFEYAFVDYNYIDPNAFLITEFDEFDPKKEKAKPYPFVATSTQCIMFDMHNNILDYLVVELPIKYKTEDGDKDGSKYTIYLGNDTIQFVQVESNKGLGEEVITIEINNNYYVVQYFIPGDKKVPARRFGYKRDAQTQGRTFVSCFHDVIPYLNKTLKIDSELDLSTAMTAFPQRFMYVDPCPECHKGTMPDGSTCKACGGTGKRAPHSSTMDIITVDMPRVADDMIDLEKMLVYKAPPIELLTFQKDYIADLKASVFLGMFNKELLTRNELVNTATEVNITEDNMNDTLHPFAQALSTMWVSTVWDIATFTDFNKSGDIILQHQYPNDFKFKSLTDLMGELTAAKTANASTSTIAAIEDDINEKLYADRPEELKIIRIKNAFNPFRGYNEENIRLLIAQGLTTHFNAVLWSNLESIFNELEQESEAGKWIYDLSEDLIREKVKAKTEEYIKVMDSDKPAEPVVNLGSDQTETNINTNTNGTE
jgi:hypothetical protein